MFVLEDSKSLFALRTPRCDPEINMKYDLKTDLAIWLKPQSLTHPEYDCQSFVDQHSKIKQPSEVADGIGA